MNRRSFIRTALAAIVATQIPAFPQGQPAANDEFRPVIVRVPEELINEATFNIESFLAAEFRRCSGEEGGIVCRRLPELWAESDEIGFLFEAAS